MGRQLLAATAALLAGAALAAPAGPELRIENAAVRVRVIPETRADVVATVSGGKGAPQPKVSRDGGSAVVDGEMGKGGISLFGMQVGGLSCEAGRVKLPGKGWVAASDLPLITVRAPYNVRISVSGASFGEVGPSSTLRLAAAGCGQWKAAPVRGGATVKLTGAPQLSLTVVGNGLSAELAGAARLSATEVNGEVLVATAGASNVDIARGRSPKAQLQLAGSGNITYGGEVGTLDSKVNGSGNIRVGTVFGMATSATRGSGGTFIGRPKGQKFCPPDCR